MKIIDEKGRLFKKINIIDFFVLLFIVGFILPSGYFGWKIYTRKPPAPASAPAPAPEIRQYYELKEKVYEFISEHKKMKKYFE